MTEQGVCRTHPYPEWWTMNRAEQHRVETPVAVTKQNGAGRLWNTTETRSAAWHAKRACSTCPVQDECRRLIDHIENGFPVDVAYYSGIWAGEGPGERMRRRYRRRRAAQAA